MSFQSRFCALGSVGSPWGSLGRHGFSRGIPEDLWGGSLGIPWGPRTLLGGALRASWETMEATVWSPGHPVGVPGICFLAFGFQTKCNTCNAVI